LKTKNLDYIRKLGLIQQSIYGIDIQPIATQISKLRFFISLIVDQKIQPQEENYGLLPLPNLDFKLVAANTLIAPTESEQVSTGLFAETESDFERKFKDYTAQYFNVAAPKEKLKLRGKIEELIENKVAEKVAQVKKLSSHRDERYIKQVADKNKVLIEERKAEAKLWQSYTHLFKHESVGFFETKYFFPEVKDGFDVVIGNPPYGASYSDTDKKYFKYAYQSAKTITNKQKGSLDTFTLFIEQGFHSLRKNGSLCFIVPIAITSSDSMTGIHNLLESSCEEIRVSSYAVRPQPVFQNAVVNTSILFFTKTETKCKRILATKMYRKSTDINLEQLINNLEFIDVFNHRLIGRYPKISLDIERSILDKIYAQKYAIRDLVKPKGKPIFYRTTGGRYYKVITNFSTGSTKETSILFDKEIANSIGAILSSSLYFWFYQIYSNNLDLKYYEVETFRIPLDKLTFKRIETLEGFYKDYLKDIEANSNVRHTTRYANIDSFSEYKIGKSKKLIDKIDDFICPLYGLTKEETEFIKNYEINFRLSDDD
jgi:hypothetical protein